jgi:hypothetical protein
MPIIDGKYEVKISTTFRSLEEALAKIEEKLKTAKTVQISNVPMRVVQPLLPLLKGREVKIILPAGEKPTEELKQLGPVAVQKARIYKDYKGTELNLGSIYFSDRVFSIAWQDDKVVEIDSMDYGKCVKCLRGTFDSAWKYSRK